MADDNVPISEADMVLQIQLHLGKTGMVNSAYTKWKKKPSADRTWKNATVWFRKALKDMETINKLTTGEAGLTANSAIKKQNAEENVHDEIQDQLGDAFNNLAMAATAKQETIDTMVNTIAELTATNAKLTEQLGKALVANKNHNNRDRDNEGRGCGGGNHNNGNTKKTWPDWCDPYAY